MQPVSFNCTHCQKKMAVTANFLGKQVRCPHCQQVVVAPAAAPTAPAPVPPTPAVASQPAPVQPLAPVQPPVPPVGNQQPAFQNLMFPLVPEKNEHESIFGEQIPEDLFDDEPVVKIEIPTGPPGGELAQADSNGLTAKLEVNHAVHRSNDPAPTTVGTDLPGNGWFTTDPHAPHSDPRQPAVEHTPAAETEPEAHAPRPRRVLVEAHGSTAMIWVLSFLIPYAVLMTAGTFYFWFLLSRAPNPYELLLDLGDNPADKNQKKGSRTQIITRTAPDGELPPHLVVPLNKSVRLGDLEVTPLSIEKRKLKIMSSRVDEQPDLLPADALVLTLECKNVSTDTVFDPLDAQFQRLYRDEERNNRPYTYLELLGKPKRFYGGPLDLSTLRKNEKIWVEGQYPKTADEREQPHDLAPGQSTKTFVATASDQKIASQLNKYKGEFLWRVQLRRGLVEYKGKTFSSTAVVGVQFTDADIGK